MPLTDIAFAFVFLVCASQAETTPCTGRLLLGQSRLCAPRHARSESTGAAGLVPR